MIESLREADFLSAVTTDAAAAERKSHEQKLRNRESLDGRKRGRGEAGNLYSAE